MQPDAARNISFISHSDMGGRLDGVQVMVHRGYAYLGQTFSNGITVLDVRDPKHPKAVNFIACPKNTRCIHLQTHDDLLLATNLPSIWSMQALTEKEYFSGSPADVLKARGVEFTSGVRIYDISRPDAPREISFLPFEGMGPHRIWYVGGRYAYVSVHFEDFTDHILTVVDVSDPTKPFVAGKAWLPGMWRGGGETPTWPAGKRYSLHHAVIANNLAFGAWRDGGMTVHDVSDPTRPKLLAHRNCDPPFGGGTHSPLPLLDRGLLVMGDEPNFANCSQGFRHIWLFDVREPSNPVSFATMPIPSEADYCAKGGNFGAHNLHENRPGSFQSSKLVFATYYNAGVRVFDIEDPFRPQEVAYYVPPAPTRMMDPRPNRPQVIQSADCYVDPNGVMYVTDTNAGLHILQFNGA